MKKLFSTEDFEKAKSTDLLPLECCFCGEIFYRPKKEIKYAEKLGDGKRCRFCSVVCGNRYAKHTITYKCDCCGKEFYLPKHLNKVDGAHHFCSKSCSAKYNNRHKKYGVRTSKLEDFLSKKIKEEYTEIVFLRNNKEAVGSELDFYFPELNLAFEINGIFHYKPVYGEEKFRLILENDKKKKEDCEKEGIELFVIDVSGQKMFKESTSLVFLKKIESILDEKLREIRKPS